VRNTPTEQAASDMRELTRLAVYYAVSGDALVVSVNEDVVKRSVDRRIAASQPATQPATTTRPWLGESLAAQVDRRYLDVLSLSLRENYGQEMQRRSWDNLPILNEWKRRFPDQDPVAFHQQHWYTKLACPGGGEYVWNDQWQTMESTVYGSPANPKAGPKAPPLVDLFDFLNMGVSFEEQGLRARAVLDHAKRN
jgi:hypothetical protein